MTSREEEASANSSSYHNINNIETTSISNGEHTTAAAVTAANRNQNRLGGRGGVVTSRQSTTDASTDNTGTSGSGVGTTVRNITRGGAAESDNDLLPPFDVQPSTLPQLPSPAGKDKGGRGQQRSGGLLDDEADDDFDDEILGGHQRNGASAAASAAAAASPNRAPQGQGTSASTAYLVSPQRHQQRLAGEPEAFGPDDIEVGGTLHTPSRDDVSQRPASLVAVSMQSPSPHPTSRGIMAGEPNPFNSPEHNNRSGPPNPMDAHHHPGPNTARGIAFAEASAEAERPFALNNNNPPPPSWMGSPNDTPPHTNRVPSPRSGAAMSPAGSMMPPLSPQSAGASPAVQTAAQTAAAANAEAIEIRRRVAMRATEEAVAGGMTHTQAIAVGVAAAAAYGAQNQAQNGGPTLTPAMTPGTAMTPGAGLDLTSPGSATMAGIIPIPAISNTAGPSSSNPSGASHAHNDKSGKPRVPNSEIASRPHVIYGVSGGGSSASGSPNTASTSSSLGVLSSGWKPPRVRQAILLDSHWMLSDPHYSPSAFMGLDAMLYTRCLVRDNCANYYSDEEDCCRGLVVDRPNVFLGLLCVTDLFTAGCPCGCFYHGMGTALFGCWSRWMVRRRYRIEGFGWEDLCMQACCVSCASAQMRYEQDNNMIYSLHGPNGTLDIAMH